jgi:Domain of unknown function (DUF4190)
MTTPESVWSDPTTTPTAADTSIQPPAPLGLPAPAEFSVGSASVPGPTFAAPDPGYNPARPGDSGYPVSGQSEGGYAGYVGYGGYAGFGGYGYGAVPGGGYYPYPTTVQKTNGLAIASLVVSIVGAVMLVCYGIGGLISIVGAILGHVARRQIRDRQEGGDGMALAGVIVGWIVTAIAAVVVAVVVVLFVMAMNSLPSEPSLQQLGWRRLS